jgi:hypothetical protein
VTQTRIPLPSPPRRYAIARRSAGTVVMLGYTHAVDALAALQAAWSAGVGRDCGSMPWKACTRVQRIMAVRRKIA